MGPTYVELLRATKPACFTRPNSHLPAVAGCASAYSGEPFMNANLTVYPGVKFLSNKT